jgi:hypothetical protein
LAPKRLARLPIRRRSRHRSYALGEDFERWIAALALTGCAGMISADNDELLAIQLFAVSGRESSVGPRWLREIKLKGL